MPVLQKYEISSLTLREEHRLRVFEIRELRKTFWSKRGEVRVDFVARCEWTMWRGASGLREEKPHDIYFSPVTV